MNNYELAEKWDYVLFKNEQVKFHPDLKPFGLSEVIDPKDYGVGIVKDYWLDIHAWGRGCIYMCKVDFGGKLIECFAGFLIADESVYDGIV